MFHGRISRREEERDSQITGAMRGWQQGELAIKPIIDFQLKPIKVFCLVVNILLAKPCPSAWTPLTPDASRRDRVDALRLGRGVWGRRWPAVPALIPGLPAAPARSPAVGAAWHRSAHPTASQGGTTHGWKQSIFQNGDHLKALKQLRRMALIFHAAPCIVYGQRVGVAAVCRRGEWTPSSRKDTELFKIHTDFCCSVHINPDFALGRI